VSLQCLGTGGFWNGEHCICFTNFLRVLLFDSFTVVLRVLVVPICRWNFVFVVEEYWLPLHSSLELLFVQFPVCLLRCYYVPLRIRLVCCCIVLIIRSVPILEERRGGGGGGEEERGEREEERRRENMAFAWLRSTALRLRGAFKSCRAAATRYVLATMNNWTCATALHWRTRPVAYLFDLYVYRTRAAVYAYVTTGAFGNRLCVAFYLLPASNGRGMALFTDDAATRTRTVAVRAA